MIISKQIAHLRNSLDALISQKPAAIVGFVPTMGALHRGHLKLIEEAAKHSDIVVVSIFVNPRQFNDDIDLQNYPRTIKEDISRLELSHCDILFLPKEEEVYPDKKEKYKVDLDGLDQIMEGKFRKGHFEGVARVVERFFNLVLPHKAFFGLKDFQQVAIIKQMVNYRQLNIEIVPVEIVRSKEGLALSSRNKLLSNIDKQNALVLYQCLILGKALTDEGNSVVEVKEMLMNYVKNSPLQLEYLEIVDQETLMSTTEFKTGTYCCLAAYCGSVRLIDNMRFS
jgi:pantoate--beta-alanine ligase